MASLTCLPFLLALCLVSIQADLRPDQVQSINRYINQILLCTGIPGMTLSIVSDGQVQMARGYGKADVEEDRDMDEDTVVLLSSLTKAFTATLLAKLLDQSEGLVPVALKNDLLTSNY